MVTRRAIALLRRGTWDREIHGFVFSVDERDCWYFVPDLDEPEADYATFLAQRVQTTGPDNARGFKPKVATLLRRTEVDEGIGRLKDALEGL